ncbi:hypothetical protein [Streptomyces sp. NPDC002122]|uniref:hypothetical protein n=1 Tax=Streptomyces sp. NPDC002122 TaxID=3154407 RepID=UPI00332E6AC6
MDPITHSLHPQGDQPGSGVHGQQFARLEAEALAPAGQVEKVGDAARLAAYLDNVAAQDGGGRDFDGGGHGAAGYPSAHRSPPAGEVAR